MAALMRAEYSIGWICALHTEYTAAKAMLDERHVEPEDPSPNVRDDNHYTLGRVGKHNIVIGVLPSGEYGTASAANVATNLIASFPSIRIGLMVGIGGGAPLANVNDIRLGDIVVSNPSNGCSGVMQYDYGKAIQDGDFQLTRVLDQPPPVLRAALAGLRSRYDEEPNGLDELVTQILGSNKRLKRNFQKPAASEDRLFRSDVMHATGKCGEACAKNLDNLTSRHDREKDEDEDNVRVHYGLIATANTLMKDAVARDRLAKDHGVMCFEMEAGGLMNSFPCLVIRGICDYSDSHKNKEWQGYAAMVAAGFAKALVSELKPAKVMMENKIGDVLATKVGNLQQLTKEILSHNMSEDMYKWLSPPDPSTNYNHAQEARQEGTGQWLLDNEQYKVWKGGSARFLWLNGKPGCGKTILSSKVIQDLQSFLSDNGRLLYFYFDFRDSTKQELGSMLRSFLYQLHLSQEAETPLDLLYASCQKEKRQPNIAQLKETLQSMLLLVDHTHIVLDALDECSTRNELLDWMTNIRKGTFRLSFLATSRPEQEIEAKIKPLSEAISLHSTQVDADISHFIHEMVYNDDSLKRWREIPGVQEEIKSALIGKANRMFRWVTCQLDLLRCCPSYPELWETLQTLPETLDETYARILEGVPKALRARTITILQFLSYGSNHLGLREAVDAVTVNLTARPRFDTNNRLPFPEEIGRYCSSLVVAVSPEGNEWSGGSDVIKVRDTAIQLAHLSVKEWLLSGRVSPELDLAFDPLHANGTLAKICIAYLLDVIPTEEDVSAEEGDIYFTKGKEMRESYPFVRYAALNWGPHLALSEETASAVALAVQLLRNKQFLTATRYLVRDEFESYFEQEGLWSPLHFALSSGLQKVTMQLLDEGADINWSTSGQDTPLHLAVELACRRNSTDFSRYGPPLPVRSRYEANVKLLLDRGADMVGKRVIPLTTETNNVARAPKKRRYLPTIYPLQRCLCRAEGGILVTFEATTSQKKQVCQLYYNNAAASYSCTGDNVIPIAARNGHLAILTLLLGYVQPNCQGPHLDLALLEAFRAGHEAAMQMLIDHGAKWIGDVERWRDGAYLTSVIQGVIREP